MGKSLDRIDSPNTEVSWTDGAHLSVMLTEGWQSHLLLQHNSEDGPTNVLRPPLDVSASGSRITYFAALTNHTPWGPIVQRGFDLTYIPGALRTDGTEAGKMDDYFGIIARATTAWPVAEGSLLLGGAVGYAPNTPTRGALQLDDPSRTTDGVAFQLAATLEDVLDDHRFGIVYGHAEGGWLLSPDFRNNDRLFEARYQWRVTDRNSFEARIRFRTELDKRVAAERKRGDRDIYLRITTRF